MEYPKSLYLNADSEADHVIVHDADAEAEKRKEGYRMAYEPQKESETKKRTRKVEK